MGLLLIKDMDTGSDQILGKNWENSENWELTRWPSQGTHPFFMILFFHNSEVLHTQKQLYGHYGIRIIAMSNLDRENWLVKPNCCVVFCPLLIQHVGRFSSGDVASLVWSSVLFWFLLNMCVSLYIYILLNYLSLYSIKFIHSFAFAFKKNGVYKNVSCCGTSLSYQTGLGPHWTTIQFLNHHEISQIQL